MPTRRLCSAHQAMRDDVEANDITLAARAFRYILRRICATKDDFDGPPISPATLDISTHPDAYPRTAARPYHTLSRPDTS